MDTVCRGIFLEWPNLCKEGALLLTEQAYISEGIVGSFCLNVKK